MGFRATTNKGYTMRNLAPTHIHTVEDAVRIVWRIIEEAKSYMEDPTLTPEEKRRWAKTLADTIGVFNKLQASQGEKQLEDEDLGTLLAKIPRTLRHTVMRRTRVWKKRNS
jgi:hypothetical protein